MTISKQPFLLLVLLLAAIAATSIAAAAGCCLVGKLDFPGAEPYEVQCANGDYAVDTGIGPIIVNQATCTNPLNGEWSASACAAINNCRQVCCCAPPDNQDHRSWVETAPYACQATGYDAVEITGDCETLCNEAEIFYTLTGTVQDIYGNPAEGVAMTVALTTIITTDTTDATTGTFSFSGLVRQTYVIGGTKGDCEVNTRTVTLSGDEPDIELSPPFILECQTTPDTCEPQWYFGFNEGSQKTCGTYDYAVDIYCSPPKEWEGQLPSKECIANEFCDDDGQQEAGEECDGDDFADGKDECADYAGYLPVGSPTCSECRIDMGSCQRCPLTTPEYCTEVQCEYCADICDDACLGEDDCTDEQPAFLGDHPKIVKGKAEIQAYWTYDTACTSSVYTATIRRWNDDGNSEYDEGEALQLFIYDGTEIGDAKLFVDDTVEADTVYCYQVDLFVNSAGEQQHKYTEIKCVETGDAACMFDYEDDMQFCASTPTFTCPTADECPPGDDCNDCTTLDVAHWRQKCNDNNELIIINDETGDGPYYCGAQTCLGPDANGRTACLNSEVCEMCGGLYGMYAYLAHTDPFSGFGVPYLPPGSLPDDESELTPCDTFVGKENGFNTCHDAKTKTINNELEGCGEVKSCYDYTTADECDASTDPCGLELNCAWNMFEGVLGEQLGLGVCVPDTYFYENDPEGLMEAEDCGLCNDQTHILPACTAELCRHYSAARPLSNCYFNTNTGRCLSRDDMSCDDYATKNDCIGGTNVSLDESNVKTPSNDYFDFGTCRYTNKCIKDADDFLNAQGQTDCRQNQRTTDLLCRTDFEPPNTIVTLVDNTGIWNAQFSVYSLKQLDFVVAVTDNRYVQSDITTYFTFIDERPNTLYDELKTLGLTSGDYKLRYYSHDPSMNLEAVGEGLDITLDNDAPVVDGYTAGLIEHEVPPGSEEWRTDVTVSYTVIDAHGPISCEAKLRPADGTIATYAGNRTFTANDGATITQEYKALRDGAYIFSVDCTDHPFLGNTMEEPFEEGILLGADKSIIEPQPVLIPFNRRQNIPLAITTQSQATCYYANYNSLPSGDKKVLDKIGNPDYDVKAFSSNDGILHTAQVTVDADSYYIYVVGCTFDNDKATDGNAGDYLIFSADTSAPATTILDGEEEYNSQVFEDAVTLKLHCEDVNEDLIMPADSWDGNFGVKTIHYCLSNVTTSGSCTFDNDKATDGNAVTFNAKEINEAAKSDLKRYYLHYSCEDNGGNLEGDTWTELLIRNLEFILPDVYLCSATNPEACEEAS